SGKAPEFGDAADDQDPDETLFKNSQRCAITRASSAEPFPRFRDPLASIRRFHFSTSDSPGPTAIHRLSVCSDTRPFGRRMRLETRTSMNRPSGRMKPSFAMYHSPDWATFTYHCRDCKETSNMAASWPPPSLADTM